MTDERHFFISHFYEAHCQKVTDETENDLIKMTDESDLMKTTL